jgi:hypothetical protein
MTEIQNSKYVWVIEYWNLRFICNLVLGIWDFGIRISKQAEGRDSYLWERLSPTCLSRAWSRGACRRSAAI